jgi:glyoxylase-like metal-dependent hydrolase (beta-lactamase superfamily II)
MESTTYRFHLGDFECIAISDGNMDYENPASFMFSNAPKDSLAQALRRHGIEFDDWKVLITPFICLVVKVGQNILLVDTGIGPGFGPGLGLLPRRLNEAGIPPESIGVILHTHAHGDHIGGDLDAAGRSVFPQARFVMGRLEWDFWTSESTLAQPQYEWLASFARKILLPLHDRFQLIEQDTKILPGLRFIGTAGHTPGHSVVELSSKGSKLLLTSDAFLHPIHIEQPGWYASVDVQPDLAVRARRTLLERASAEQALVLSFHFSFPGLGYIRKGEAGYRWEPISARIMP